MSKILRYCFFSFVFFQKCWAQQDIQFRVDGANSGCYVTSMAIDQESNILITGYYHKEKTASDTLGLLVINQKQYTLSGVNGAFTAKINEKKEVLWLKIKPLNIKNINTEAHVVIDATNNIYVTGRFQKNSLISNDSPTGEMFITKYAPDGTLLWEKTSEGISDNGEFKPEIDKTGNLYILGRYQADFKIDSNPLLTNTNGESLSYLLKLSTAGKVVWVKTFPSNTNLNTISVNTANELLLAGEFQDNVQFGNGVALQSAGMKDIFYAKYDLNGEVLWAKTIGGSQDDECHNIRVDNDGNIFLAGLASNEAYFGSLQVKSAPADSRNIFLTKVKSTSGQVEWVKNMPFGGASTATPKHQLMDALQVNASGDVYLYGVVSGFLNVDTETKLVPEFFPIYYLLKYKADGSLSYARKYSVSDGGGVAYWNEMVIDTKGLLRIVGGAQNYARINGSRNDTGFMIEKTEINACNSQPLLIKKFGESLIIDRVVETAYQGTENIIADKELTYQWYKNGEKISKANEKQFVPKEEGYYSLQLVSNTTQGCTKKSNSIGIYSPSSGPALILAVNYTTQRLTTKTTMAGSQLEWYRNEQQITNDGTSIAYNQEGVYKVKERLGNIVKESNEITVRNAVAVGITQLIYNQDGDPCKPGPLLKCTLEPNKPVLYQWFLNGVLVNDSTRNHFSPVTTGEYQVSVYFPNENQVYISGKYKLTPQDFPKSLPIEKTEDVCNGKALLKVSDAFMQKYEFQSIVWRLDGTDIPEATEPYYVATKGGYYTFSVKYLLEDKTTVCNYNSFIEYNKKPEVNLNLGYAYAGSGCVVDSFKIFVGYNAKYTYTWMRNDTILKNANTNELFIKDKGKYKGYIVRDDGCIKITDEVSLKGCTPENSNKFLLLNPPAITADKSIVYVNEKSLIKSTGCTDVNFQWLKDTMPIAGATQANLEVSQSGGYSLKIEKFGCEAVSNPVKIIVENILSSEEKPPLNILVYPNPVTEVLSVQLPVSIHTKVPVTLNDSRGIIIHTWLIDKQANLTLKDLPEGVYLLTFEIDQQRIVKKIIKKSD